MGEDEHTCCSHYVRSQPFPKDGQVKLYPEKKVYPNESEDGDDGAF